jgi:hypothetical protein
MEKAEIAYIAGKITGDPQYGEKFARAEKYLRILGYSVINPCCLPEGLGYEDYMLICFAMVEVADLIFMLPDWKDSKGAARELERHLKNGKAARFLSEEELLLADAEGPRDWELWERRLVMQRRAT